MRGRYKRPCVPTTIAKVTESYLARAMRGANIRVTVSTEGTKATHTLATCYPARITRATDGDNVRELPFAREMRSAAVRVLQESYKCHQRSLLT